MEKIIYFSCFLVCFMVTTCFASDNKVTIKSYGHSAFQLFHDNTSLLFDPYLTDNPNKVVQPQDIKADYILVSHGHFDHLGDTYDIAKRTGATVIATAELTNLPAAEGCKVYPMHIGGKANFDFGYVRVTEALHGAGVAGGHASGFIVNFYGKTIYFAGDTGLFGDMELLGKLEKIDYAILPIGDTYTMGPADAVEAVGLLKPKYVIPMHYNTWPIIKQNPQTFKEQVEKRFSNTKVFIVEPGQTIQL